MNSDINEIIKPLFGKEQCEARVGGSRSLSIGFGERIVSRVLPHNKKYHEWEIGTYYSSWRIVQNGRIICGSGESAESIGELDVIVKDVKFGTISTITNLNHFDIRVEFDGGLSVDFFPAMSDEDEYFHIFCPHNMYVQFSSGGKWEMGKSDVPWMGKERPDTDAK